MKKHFSLLAASLLFISPLLAQSWISMMKDQNANVHDVQNSFYQWYSGYSSSDSAEEQDGPYEQFKRWEWLMEPRTYPSGNHPDVGSISRQYQEYLTNQSAVRSPERSLAGAANWKYTGNESVPESGGDGRVNYIRFMPGNSNTIFACSPTGGLWETTNGGLTWSTKTDNLLDMSISDIAINPANTNIMYISTGDGDGIYGGYTTLSTVGVLKSTDGGNTWNTTGLSYTQAKSGPAFSTVNQLWLDPDNANCILAGASFGLFKTTNAGVTWRQVDTGDFRSIEMEPFHSHVVYAATYDGQFFRSTDTGSTWKMIASGLPAAAFRERMKIAVTPADSNYVYLVAAPNGTSAATYRSADRGQTFTQMSSTDQIGYQWWYTMCLCVSPTNADSLFEAGLDNYVSADGGGTWKQVSSSQGRGHPYVHADVHCITPVLGSGSAYYECNDGGVFKCIPTGDVWTNMSNNLEIGALYNIGPSADSSNMWLSGWQDNGVNLSSPFWQEVYGGDGMVSFIDYSNDNTWYVENYGGDFQVSFDAGISWNSISQGLPGGPWVTKWLQAPRNPYSLFGGLGDVWNTTNQGSSWKQISKWGNAANPKGYISAISIYNKNDSVIYAAQPGIIEVTTNGGTTWKNITTGLPVDSAGISSITIDSRDSARAWVSFSGYVGSSKVFQTTNMGATWTNISSGLPNLPVNCILCQRGTPESVYIGMDAGVYYRDTLLNKWIVYNTGLPNVIVNDIQIFYPTNTLLAATYGRGVWSSPTSLNSSTTGIDASTNYKNGLTIYPNPSNGKMRFDAELAQPGKYDVSIYNMMGQKVYYNQIAISEHYSSSFDISSYGAGVYLFVLSGNGQVLQKKIVIN